MADTSDSARAEIVARAPKVWASILVNDLLPRIKKSGIGITEFGEVNSAEVFMAMAMLKVSGKISHDDVRKCIDWMIDDFRRGRKETPVS